MSTESNKGKSTKLGQRIDAQVAEISLAYYEAIDCPRSLTCAILLRYAEYDQLMDLTMNPSDFADPRAFRNAALATDWLRKYSGFPGSTLEDRQRAAKMSWLESEEQCLRTNTYWNNPHWTLKSVQERLSYWMADFIGPFPLDLSPRFGPGATLSDKSTHVTVLDKLTSHPTVTSSWWDIARFIWRDTLWAKCHEGGDGVIKPSGFPKVVENNTFFTVPKDARTERGCAKGPSLNVAYQLAAGRAIRTNLRTRWGYDLAKKQDHHKMMACQGSLYGHLVTIDCSRASDTMAKVVVLKALGRAPLWEQLLSSLRERWTTIDDVSIKVEKFSAMGNGFTFELETILFLSLCCVAAELSGYTHKEIRLLVRSGTISVYGDDIIVPVDCSSVLVELLTVSGFSVNTRKSYFNGLFRESCGGDYFAGEIVNTVKLVDVPSQPSDWFSIHNRLRERFVARHATPKSFRLLRLCRSYLPRSFKRLFGPKWLGDLVLHGSFTAETHEMVGPLAGKDRPTYQTIKCLAPRLTPAPLEHYLPSAQLAYIVYTGRSDRPLRRPAGKPKYTIARHSDVDYAFGWNEVPKLSKLLPDSGDTSLFHIPEFALQWAKDGKFLR